MSNAFIGNKRLMGAVPMSLSTIVVAINAGMLKQDAKN
jgi:hypothetical protein